MFSDINVIRFPVFRKLESAGGDALVKPTASGTGSGASVGLFSKICPDINVTRSPVFKKYESISIFILFIFGFFYIQFGLHTKMYILPNMVNKCRCVIYTLVLPILAIISIFGFFLRAIFCCCPTCYLSDSLVYLSQLPFMGLMWIADNNTVDLFTGGCI